MSLLHTLHSYILNCWQSVHYLYASTFPPTIILHPLPQWMYFPDAWTSQAYLGKLILTFLPLSGITLLQNFPCQHKISCKTNVLLPLRKSDSYIFIITLYIYYTIFSLLHYIYIYIYIYIYTLIYIYRYIINGWPLLWIKWKGVIEGN